LRGAIGRENRKTRLLEPVRQCTADSAGVTAIEYALIAGIVVIAVTALVDSIGTSLDQMLSSLTTAL
jgi:Flp pilus assembly pilin Flp